METKEKLMFGFGMLMLMVYWGMGYLLVFTSLFEEKIAPIWRYLMGGLFFVYGCFRAYRQFKRKEY